ncbi:MAG: glucans biosynthesis glucosyltransferase MdoH [Ottowia sp.]|nr:glucans biosynthesis glucosyltransferase MdoH [Ottowia sp.]
MTMDADTASAAHAACKRYAARLPLAPDARQRLVAAAAGAASVQAALAGMHEALAEEAAAAHPAYASVGRRLQMAWSEAPAADPPFVVRDANGRPRLATAPALQRTSMVPDAWLGRPAGRLARWTRRAKERLFGRRGRLASSKALEPQAPPAQPRPWKGAGRWRRSLLTLLVAAQTVVASYYMSVVLPYHGTRPLELAALIVYALLFAWISFGFWTAMMGFVSLLAGRGRYDLERETPSDQPLAPEARTAVVMAICNEDVRRVYAGLRATWESLAATDVAAHFDLFILSDTSDPDTRVAELVAWRQLCAQVAGFGRIFYRHRTVRIKRKSGNISDFCRRWGSRYRYMVVLDADSVMSGHCLKRLAQIMEAHPGAGIVQTAPRAAGRDTLYARFQQFATRVYGPVFTAGLHFWQLGESHYWGHNAIIRVAPFIRHCALGRLPGRGPLAGEILSHDFVEAALMRRAGWGVWIAYGLTGSYEDMPPNLLDELKRDRRWCQGNLMNFRLFFSKGLQPAHRAIFMIGVMAYLSAPIWFAFLLLSTALLVLTTLRPPQYFVQPYQLFPIWPQWHPGWAVGLFTATVLLLFLPKILAMLLHMVKDARGFGGPLRLLASTLLEFLFSAVLAPIRMLFHTSFVILPFLGISLQWKSPQRGDAQTSWRMALRHHALGTLLGTAWAAGVYWVNPGYLWWLAPIVGSLIVSIPISVYSSRTTLGRAARRKELLLIPEETNPPPELRATARYNAEADPLPGFASAVLDPAINALVCAAGRPRPFHPMSARQKRRLPALALQGLDALDDADRNLLLNDPLLLSWLHQYAWAVPEAAMGCIRGDCGR